MQKPVSQYIVLTSELLHITAVTVSTNAEFFRDLKVGDVLVLHYRLQHLLSGAGGNRYAGTVEVVCVTSGKKIERTINELVGYRGRLRGFELTAEAPEGRIDDEIQG